MSLHNTSDAKVYFQGPLIDAPEWEKKFMAGVYLVGVSDDGVTWQQRSPRQPVDSYDNSFDTVKPNATLTKLAYLQDADNEKYLRLKIEYKTDSSFYEDTVLIER